MGGKSSKQKPVKMSRANSMTLQLQEDEAVPSFREEPIEAPKPAFVKEANKSWAQVAAEPAPAPEPAAQVSTKRDARELWQTGLRKVRALKAISSVLDEVRTKDDQAAQVAESYANMTMAQLVAHCREIGLVGSRVFVALSRAELLEMLVARERGELTEPVERADNPMTSQLHRTLTSPGVDTNTMLLQLMSCVDTTMLPQNPHDAAFLEKPSIRRNRLAAAKNIVRTNSRLPPQAGDLEGADAESPVVSEAPSIPSALVRAHSSPPVMSFQKKLAQSEPDGLRVKSEGAAPESTLKSDGNHWELDLSQVQVRLEHMRDEVPLICSTDNIEGVEGNMLLELLDANKEAFSDEVLDMWRGWQDAKLFSNVDTVRSKLTTIVEYGESRASEDIKKRLRCIAYLLTASSKEFDIPSILLCLAQNGGVRNLCSRLLELILVAAQVCDVQKEVGVRMVYAQMTGNQAADNAALSLEGSLSQLLQATREAMAENVAIDVIDAQGLSAWGEGVHNTHDMFPIRNGMSEVIGLPRIPDPNSEDKPLERDWIDKFLARYSPELIIQTVLIALNEHPRKIKYEPAVEWVMANSPDGLDAYDFMEEVVFDLDTGHFTKQAVQHILFKTGVLERICTDPQQRITDYISEAQSEEEKMKTQRAEEEARLAEERRKEQEAAEKAAAEARAAEEARQKAEREAIEAHQAAVLDSLTDEEREIISRIVEFGFSQEAVIQAFIACDRNEQMTANFLLEFGA